MDDEVAMPAPSQFQSALRVYQMQTGKRKDGWGRTAVDAAGTDLACLRRAYLAFEPGSALEKKAVLRICKASKRIKQWIANLGIARPDSVLQESFLLHKTVAELMNRSLTSYDWHELVRTTRHSSSGGRYIQPDPVAAKLYILGAKFLLDKNPRKYLEWRAIFLLALAAGSAEMALNAFQMMRETAKYTADLQDFAIYSEDAKKSRAKRLENEG